jgi:hypothetical protein
MAAVAEDADTDLWPVSCKPQYTKGDNNDVLVVSCRKTKWLKDDDTVVQFAVSEVENDVQDAKVRWINANEFEIRFMLTELEDLQAAVAYLAKQDSVQPIGQYIGDTAITEANPMQCMWLLGMLEVTTTEATTLDNMYELLSPDPEKKLSSQSTQEDIYAAWQHFRMSLGYLHEQGKALGVFGKYTDASAARSVRFDRILVRATSVYMVVLSVSEFERTKRADFDPTDTNVFGYQSAIDVTRDKRETCTDLLEVLLAFTAKNNLRRLGNTVYQQQKTTVVHWNDADQECSARKAADHEGVECDGPCMYGTMPDDRWCLAYARYKCTGRCCDQCKACLAGTPCQHTDPSYKPPKLRHDKCNKKGAIGKVSGALVRNVVCCTQPEDKQSTVFAKAKAKNVSSAVPVWVDSARGHLKVTKGVGCRTWVQRIVNGMPQLVEELVMEVLDRRKGGNTAQWRMFTENFNKFQSMCASYLSKTWDASFPMHIPSKHLFSFRNGMYDIKTNTFHEYGKIPADWNSAVNFIDEHFDPVLTTQPLNLMRVPGYDDIVASQGYKELTKEWLDAFLGRLFFFLGELDKWQMGIVLKGTGATGKSTIARAIMKIVGERNIGQIPSNCEEQYALASVHDKEIWMCTEMKAGFRLSLATLQSMISGDPVTVHAKFKDARDIPEWRTHGLLIGNELPSAWRGDAGGALARRFIVFEFGKKPSRQDPEMQSKFLNNLAIFLVRTVRMYLFKADVQRTSGFGDDASVLGAELVEFQSTFKNDTSVFRRFLTDEHPGFVIMGAATIVGATIDAATDVVRSKDWLDESARCPVFHYVLTESGGPEMGIVSNGDRKRILDPDWVERGTKKIKDAASHYQISAVELRKAYTTWKTAQNDRSLPPNLNDSLLTEMCQTENLLYVDKTVYGVKAKPPANTVPSAANGGNRQAD